VESISLADTAEFCRTHFPCTLEWGDDLEKWITWASSKKFLFQVTGEDEKLAGLGIARPVAHISGIKDNNDWHDERQGKYVFVDLIIGKTKEARQALALLILTRFGEREFTAFRRNGKMKIHRTKNARKALMKQR
jgi:hypothetical protein